MFELKVNCKERERKKEKEGERDNETEKKEEELDEILQRVKLIIILELMKEKV